MKEFSKYVFATVVGIIVTFIIFSVLGLMSIIGIIASSEATQSVDENSVLVINLNGAIEEQGVDDNPFNKFMGDNSDQMGLNEILSAITKAKYNDNIKGIYIEAGGLATGYSTLQEIRNALKDFKKSKKWIVAYADSYTQGSYYVSSVADKVYLNPQGSVDLHGIASQAMFVKDLYAKFGIRHQIIKVGKYKSATEIYSEDHMSDANREQVTAYVTGLWKNIITDIAESRKLSVDTVSAYADQLAVFFPTEQLEKKKLVDGLLYNDEIKVKVKQLLKLKEEDEIPQISVSQMRNVKEAKKNGDEIAVYYASGVIVDTPSGGIMNMNTSQIVGTEMSKDLASLADDDDVKAVVIRVNSPGGSAYASEQIWHQVSKLKAKKPVVISMGDYAASGGYYISCNASWIVAQPTTLTGSIGIYGVIAEGSEGLTKKLGLHFDGVKTNKHADMDAGIMGIAIRPFDAEETALLQGYINRGYSLFCKRVADGRKQKTEHIEEIAQGRVWLGSDAMKIKLVDQLGGIEVAVAKAAQLAKLSEYYTEEYPSPADWTEQLMNTTAGNNNYLEQMKLFMGDWYLPFMAIKSATEHSPIQASTPIIVRAK